MRVFYSWQSDRGQNRNFIRSALDAAVKELVRDPEFDEPLRELEVDQDTQNVPGSPAVGDTILGKIREADIFVADLTFIDSPTSDSSKRLPNPNVMLEYGYALHALTDARILAVFNEAFGPADLLPFDLRYRRWPIRFHLPEDSNQEQRSEAKRGLKEALKLHIRSIVTQLATATAIPSQPPFLAAEAADGIGLLRRAQEPLCIPSRHGGNEDLAVRLKSGPYSFLRLIPTTPHPKLGHVEASRIAQSDLRTMDAARGGGGWNGRHATGAVTYWVEPEKPDVAWAASELFLTRELWGNEFFLLSRERERDQTFGFVPTGAMEEIFLDSFIMFSRLAREVLQVALPIRISCGLVGVEDFRLAVSQQRFGSQFAGRIVEPQVTYETLLNDWQADPFDVLKPLFEAIYDVAGVARPDERSAGRLQR